MKLSKEQIVRTALDLLDQVGLEGLTLRKIATELGVQAPALYWHVKNKEQLLDEMATTMLLDASAEADFAAEEGPWQEELRAGAAFYRRQMLSHRDGAKAVSGTYFTGSNLPIALDRWGIPLLRKAGMSTEQAADVLTTMLHFTSGFVIEEQEIFPYPGQRDPRYALDVLNEHNPDRDPAVVEAVFSDDVDRRFNAGLDLIIGGAERMLADSAAER